MPKWILAHDADVKRLAIIHRVRGREPNKFAKIEEVRRFNGVFRDRVLRAAECGNDAQSDERRAASSLRETSSQCSQAGGAGRSAGLGGKGSHLTGVSTLVGGIVAERFRCSL